MAVIERQETPDSHDYGKLTKWHDGLVSGSSADFPLCALFLASGEDIRAHNIFRVYRTSFESLGAGFHDLVIFGQHGLSSTCTELIPGFGLVDVTIPSLVLICSGQGIVLHTTTLPSGDLDAGVVENDSGDVPWRAALTAIEKHKTVKPRLSLAEIKGLSRVEYPERNLIETVGQIKKQVEKTIIV